MHSNSYTIIFTSIVTIILGGFLSVAAGTLKEIQDLNDRFVCLLVSRDKLTDVVSNLLTDFDIIDLEISDPPIDQLIGELFIKGEVN